MRAALAPGEREADDAPAVQAEAAPVFVDQSGLRGRLLRGIGWPVGMVGAMLAAAMTGSLIGIQSEAPAMTIPPQLKTTAPAVAPRAKASLSPVPSPTTTKPTGRAVPSGSPTAKEPTPSARRTGRPSPAPTPSKHR